MCARQAESEEGGCEVSETGEGGIFGVGESILLFASMMSSS